MAAGWGGSGHRPREPRTGSSWTRRRVPGSSGPDPAGRDAESRGRADRIQPDATPSHRGRAMRRARYSAEPAEPGWIGWLLDVTYPLFAAPAHRRAHVARSP